MRKQKNVTNVTLANLLRAHVKKAQLAARELHGRGWEISVKGFVRFQGSHDAEIEIERETVSRETL